MLVSTRTATRIQVRAGPSSGGRVSGDTNRPVARTLPIGSLIEQPKPIDLRKPDLGDMGRHKPNDVSRRDPFQLIPRFDMVLVGHGLGDGDLKLTGNLCHGHSLKQGHLLVKNKEAGFHAQLETSGSCSGQPCVTVLIRQGFGRRIRGQSLHFSTASSSAADYCGETGNRSFQHRRMRSAGV